MKRIPQLSLLTLLLSGFIFSALSAQSFKDKLKAKVPKKKVNLEMYECGHVHKPSTAEKLNPMKAVQKGLGGGAAAAGNNKDLGASSISIFYQAHIHPQGVMRFPTKTPGWETCGDAVYAAFTNRNGMGLSNTDGKMTLDGQEIVYGGVGTYFKGFSPDKRGHKQIQITSSNGDKIDLEIGPAAPLSIKSINGKPKGSDLLIDGTEDVVIELENGAADPASKLHVQMVCKLVGTPLMYDIIVTPARNQLVIPKEAFKNFEGSPSPFIKNNILIVNRVKETVIEGTDAGALRTLSAYMDWTPVSVGGDLSKGNMITMGFDSTKNTRVDINLTTRGEYNFAVNKAGPYASPPLDLAKKVAIASFVVRGNLQDEEVTITSSTYTTVTTTTRKWFPELSDQTWQRLADQMYQNFAGKLEQEMGWDIMPLPQVVGARSYRYAKGIKDQVERTFVEKGAGGTKRMLSSSIEDLVKDMSITFASDHVSERLIRELGVDMVLAVTVDMNFNFDSEGLDPRISIVGFAPSVSYKTPAKYFSMTATTDAKSLDDSRQYRGGVENVMYQMMKIDAFNQGFLQALKELKQKENTLPAYEALWKVKM
ncbi:MAG: hypothetical protein AAFR61_30005 [Bacteroidota bacterium]